MQLMRLAEVPATDRDRVFRYSGGRALIGAAVLVAFAVGALLFAWKTANWLAYYFAAVVTIFALIFHKLVTARFRPTNWLVRMSYDGLFIKFRSYLNEHFPAQDHTVVFIPYSEIRSAKSMKERQELLVRDDRGRAATTTKIRRLVELELAGDSQALAEALTEERALVYAKTVRSRAISSRYHHLPVQLAAPAYLRIEWGVVPGAQRFLDELTRHTLVRPAEESSKDFVRLDGLSTAEQESGLLELAESGDKIGAIAMARKLYSYDLTTAKNFVEGLAGKQAEGKQSR